MPRLRCSSSCSCPARPSARRIPWRRAHPHPPQAALPDFLKPGLRISYHGGNSVVQGVSSHLVRKEDGSWVDPATGQKWSDEQKRTSGGVGFTQLTVLRADADAIVADLRHFLINDEQNRCTSAGGAALAGTAATGLGDLWIPPAKLAALADERAAGSQVNRVRYTAAGREYNAISVVQTTPTSYASKIYDLQTGLLLAMSTSNTGDPVPVLSGNQGQVGVGRGATAVSHLRFLGTRQLQAPWADDPPPQRLTKGRQLVYQGGYRSITPSGAAPPLAMTSTISILDQSGPCVIVRVNSRSDIGPGLPPQERNVDRAYGPVAVPGLWAPPAALRQLRPGQVLDQDPVTGFAVSFGQLQGNAAVLIEQAPLEQTQCTFDLNSGLLSQIVTTRTQAFGQIQYQVQLTGQQ